MAQEDAGRLIAPSRRALAARALELRLPPALAHASEHACHVLAAAQGKSYPRLVFRLLHLLELGHVTADTVLRLGPRLAAGAPLELLVGAVPAREAIRREEEARQESRALLEELARGELADLPDNAGVRCKRCGSNEVSYEFLQTRSADEGTTIFCTCRCGKRWKM